MSSKLMLNMIQVTGTCVCVIYEQLLSMEYIHIITGIKDANKPEIEKCYYITLINGATI